MGEDLRCETMTVILLHPSLSTKECKSKCIESDAMALEKRSLSDTTGHLPRLDYLAFHCFPHLYTVGNMKNAQGSTSSARVTWQVGHWNGDQGAGSLVLTL